MNKAIVFDIDGVILSSEYIFREIFDLDLHGDDKWEHFYKRCNSNDTKLLPHIKEFIDMVNSVPETISIIASTSRSERCRQGTIDLLSRYGIHFASIYMRADEDYRPSEDVKKEHLTEIRKEYDILAFIDDEINNCRMAKDIGILALRRV